jgi:hypothetical protein
MRRTRSHCPATATLFADGQALGEGVSAGLLPLADHAPVARVSHLPPLPGHAGGVCWKCLLFKVIDGGGADIGSRSHAIELDEIITP